MPRNLMLDCIPKEKIVEHFKTSKRGEYDWISIYKEYNGTEIVYIVSITPEAKEGKSSTSQRLEIKDFDEYYRSFDIEYPSGHDTVKDLTEKEHVEFIVSALKALDVENDWY